MVRTHFESDEESVVSHTKHFKLKDISVIFFYWSDFFNNELKKISTALAPGSTIPSRYSTGT